MWVRIDFGYNAPPMKRGGPATEATESERVPVLVAVQRGSRLTHDCTLDGVDAQALTNGLRPALAKDAVLSSDGNASYRIAALALGMEAAYFVTSYHGPRGKDSLYVETSMPTMAA